MQPYYPYPASEKAGAMMDESYRRMAEYLNVDPSEIHFGPSTTQNAYVLANAMRPMWKEGDEIIVSCQDHEANAGAWRRLGQRGMKIIEWHVDPKTGVLDTEVLESLLTDRTRMIAYPHCSNVIGDLNPVKEITRMAHKHGALSVVDGVGWAPHGLPDLKDLDVDIYMFPSYKTYGPHLGVLYVKGSHAQVGSAAGILDYLDAVYAHHFGEEALPVQRNHALNELFRAHETALLEPLMEFLKSREDIRIVGPATTKNRAPIVSILPKKKAVLEVYHTLTRHKLMLGYGNFYAYRPLMDMNIPTDPGVIRISFVHYTSPEEIQQVITGLKNALD